MHPPTVYHFVHALLPFLCDETGLLAKYAEHVAVAQALCGSPPPARAPALYQPRGFRK